MSVPQWADTDAVDPHLGEHVDADPLGSVATDGGESVGADKMEDVRPGDCDCGAFHGDTSLPCWPCHREGFEKAAGGNER